MTTNLAPASVAGESQVTPGVFLPRTVLVVDDMPAVRMSLSFLLGGGDFRVLQAASGSEAVQMLESESIDGALIDIHMPGMNGFETCLQLRAVAVRLRRPLRVWFMTGAGAKSCEKRAAELGAHRVFAKPFALETLVQQLKEDFQAQAPEPAPNSEKGA